MSIVDTGFHSEMGTSCNCGWDRGLASMVSALFLGLTAISFWRQTILDYA
jgi:hypothetical protein